MTSRIGGPIPPDSPRGSRGAQGADGGKFQKEMRKVEEIEKVGEVDLDQKRKRVFKTPIEEEGELTHAPEPSPFQPEFHLPKPPVGFSELDDDSSKLGSKQGLGAIAASPQRPPEPDSAAFAPPPVVDKHLPESERFWEDYDLPDQPLKSVEFKERSLPKKPERLSEAEEKKRLIEEKNRKSLKGFLEKSAAPEEEPFLQEKSQKTLGPAGWHEKPFSKTEKKEAGFSKEGMKKQGKPLSEDQLEEMPSLGEKEEAEAHLAQKMNLPEEMAQVSFAERSLIREIDEKEREKKKAKGETPSAVRPPDPLPPACQQVAQAALTAASPFLNTQTAELYLKMVGTMVFMASSKGGISLTEVMLNSPVFKNSVLFNSTITIEKYATAPDSFNIRFTGTPEAIQVFSNNLGRLSSAFVTAYEEKRVSFRVGRLETELASDRHLIRRKKEGGSKDNLR